MIEVENIRKEDLAYIWITDEGKYYCWLINRLTEWVKTQTNLEICMTPIDRKHAVYVRKNCGLEQHRLNRITKEVIESTPLFYAEFEPCEVRLIDGNHRYVRAAQLHIELVPAFIFPREVHERFQLRVRPEHKMHFDAMRHQHSGLM